MIQVDRCSLISVLTCLALVAPRTIAQEVAVAQVDGQVLDTTGALVPSADVTMTAGIRWEPMLFPQDIYGRGSIFSMADFLSAFNAINHTNFSNLATTFTSATFGRITAAGDPRILQFALKLNF